MTRATQPRRGLLLAAHGERRPGAHNDGIRRLVDILARGRLADEIGFGLLSGRPSLAEAIERLRSPAMMVYPLFLSDGFFACVRLRQAVAQSRGSGSRMIRILDPLGLDPGLGDLIARKATAMCRRTGHDPGCTTLVLLAHGSTRDAGSRIATQKLAAGVSQRNPFREVCTAFLEEPPSLTQVLRATDGAAIVVGLFAGEGLHGAEDVPRLIAAAQNATFAGNVGTWPELADIIAAGVTRASLQAEP